MWVVTSFEAEENAKIASSIAKIVATIKSRAMQLLSLFYMNLKLINVVATEKCVEFLRRAIVLTNQIRGISWRN